MRNHALQLLILWLTICCADQGVGQSSSDEPLREGPASEVDGVTFETTPFEVNGTLDYKLFNPDGTLRRHSEYGFVVYVNGCRWLIRTYSTSDDLLKKGARYWETGTDGTNIHSFIRLNSPEVNLQRMRMYKEQFDDATSPLSREEQRRLETQIDLLENQESESVNDSVGFVYQGQAPLSSSRFSSILWTAYASACYLRGQTNGRVLQIWGSLPRSVEISDRPDYQAQVSMLGGPLDLPAQIVFFNDGTYLMQEPAGHKRKAAYKPPFDSGFTNAVYEVHDTQSFDGLRLPLRFSLMRYVPVNGAVSNDDLWVMETIEAHATNVDLRAGEKGTIPQPTPKTIVDDHRYAMDPSIDGPVQYLTGTDRWPDSKSVQQSQEYERAQWQKKARSIASAKLGRRGLIVAGTILLLSLSFPLFFLYRAHQHRKPLNK